MSLPFALWLLHAAWLAGAGPGGRRPRNRSKSPRHVDLSVGSVGFIGCRRHLSFFLWKTKITNNPPPVTYRNPNLCNHGKSSSSSLMARICSVTSMFGANGGRRRHILCCFDFLAGITNDKKCQCEDWWSAGGGWRS